MTRWGICIFFPVAVMAQWHEGIECWNPGREGVERHLLIDDEWVAGPIIVSNAYAAIAERSCAIGLTPAPIPPRTNSYNRGLLQSCKSRIKSILLRTGIYKSGLRYWVDMKELENAGGALEYLQQNGSSNVWKGTEAFPRLTWSSICEYSNLPKNYLEYTPYSYLQYYPSVDGIGFTNEWTEVDTDTLPSGRTKWYTSDYGWYGIRGLAKINFTFI